MKTLHTFEVKLEKEVEKIDKKTENGQEITIKSIVKESVPHTLVMKEPSRREKQALSLFYGIAYTEALNQGLWPKVLVVQKFLKDPNSPLSQDEDTNLAKMYEQLESLRNDYLRVNALPESDDQKTKKESILMQYLALNKKVMDIESAYSSLFSHTAENYAQDQAIQWTALHLFYLQKGDKFEPLFPGAGFKEKQEHAFELEDKNDDLYFKAIDRISLFAGLYFLGQATKPEDFKRVEEEWAKQLATKPA